MPTAMVPLQATLQPCTAALFMAESMSYLLSLTTSVCCSVVFLLPDAFTA